MSDAASNRAAFPETARIVDDLRAVFGQDVKLVWAEENGRTLGVRDLPGTQVLASEMVLRAPEIPARDAKGRR